MFCFPNCCNILINNVVLYVFILTDCDKFQVISHEMSTDIVHDSYPKNVAEDSALSHDSEYDDFLGVPESLEITINEDGETISIRNSNLELTDNRGKIILIVSNY